MRSTFVLLAVLLVASIVVPTAYRVGDPPADPRGDGDFLVATPAAAIAVRGIGGELLADYGGFTLARLTGAQLDRLARFGFETEPVATTIGLDGHTFDTTLGEPTLPADLRAGALDAYGRGLFLVQFRGPILKSWVADLEDLGAEAVQYVPHHALLVRARAEVIRSADGLPQVRWSGGYAAAYRIHPDLDGRTGTVAVKVLALGEEGALDARNLLLERGLGVVDPADTHDGVDAVFQVGNLGIVRARVPAAWIPDLARLPRTVFIEPWFPMRAGNAAEQRWLQTANSGADVRRIWTMGIRGDGQIVALSDTGLDFDHNMIRESTGTIQLGGISGPGSIYNTTDLSRRKLVRYLPMSVYAGVDPWTGGDVWAYRDSPTSVPCPSGHGTRVTGAAVGGDAGIGTSIEDGMAPNAKAIMEDIGSVRDSAQCANDDVLIYIPNDYQDLFGPAYDEGARIHTNSWGSPTNDYDLEAMMTDRFIWDHPDLAVLFAAGNGGPGLNSVGSPGTAKNVMTIGGATATSGADNVQGNSARGPTADGRLKPDYLTFFNGISITSSGDPTDNSGIAGTGSFSGTSYATPLAAGMTALARQYFTDGWSPTGTAIGANGHSPSAALLKATMTASSRKMTGSGSNTIEDTYPNSAQGFGRLVLDDGLFFVGDARKLWWADPKAGLATGQSVEYRIRVASTTPSIRIVLAWSDYPGAPNANPALVNNLDLEVTDPAGNVYKGNVWGTFAQGESQPNTGAFDALNPIEGVIRLTPAVGVWTLRVRATNVPFGPQPFGLVAVADLDPGYGDLFLDKKVYSESDTIRIEVRDTNAGSVSVSVGSDTEPAPEVVPLVPTALGSGVWRGTINTAFTTPSPDGVLSVSDRDTITATYTDASPAHVVVTTATVDADRPAISNVRVDEISNSGATVRWDTSESANSTVLWGDTPALGNATSDSGFTRTHAVGMRGLQANRLYYLDVASSDTLGHSTRDDNAGRHYTFQTSPKGDILLVIGSDTFTDERVRMYRSALSASGWPTSEWHRAAQGDPPLSVLQEYRAVLWQVGLEQYPAFDDSSRQRLSQYLDGGGRLFISSHDVMWDLCSTASGDRTAERCQWVRDKIKAVYQADPTTWSTNFGILADPISGAYTTGVPYVPHRSGGSGDEIDNLCGTTGDSAVCTRAGATTRYVWRNSNDHVSIRWESTAANDSLPGDDPAIVWDGLPSRFVAFFFEFTGINYAPGVLSSAARTDILDRTVMYLVGDRDHPDVTVTAPNGGEVITGPSTTITWTTAGSAPIARHEIYYSNNSGQSWTLITNNAGGSVASNSYVWDVSALPNGIRYRVKVVAVDSLVPSLSGADTSNADFAIRRPGGDLEGPLVWAGSVTTRPDPVYAGATIRFNATVDDRNRGGSVIADVRYYIQSTRPSQGDPGWTAMFASDGTFDADLEGVTALAAAVWPLGTRCVWVQGRDAAGNWGPFEGSCFTVNAAPVDTYPPQPAGMLPPLLAPTQDDVTVRWNAASDEGAPSGTVLYRLFRATSILGPWTQVGADIPGSGLPSYQVVETGRGHVDSLAYFWYVQTEDSALNNASSRIGAKVSLSAPSGRFLLSVPVTAQDPTPSSVFQTNAFQALWTYDAADAQDPWKTYASTRSANDAFAVDLVHGYWVNSTVPGRYTVAGLVPSLTSISLRTGWTLAGYPSFLTGFTVGDLKLLVPAVRTVVGFDATAPPYLTRVLPDSYVLRYGEGYWVESASTTTWIVPGS